MTHRRNTPCLRAREETSDIIHAEGVRGDGYHPRRRRVKPGSGLLEPGNPTPLRYGVTSASGKSVLLPAGPPRPLLLLLLALQGMVISHEC